MADILLSIEKLARASGGRIAGANGVPGFSSVAIDSRKVEQGGLFVAMVGSQQDGHDYLGAALEKGAAVALVAEQRMAKDAMAFESLARKHGAALVIVKDTMAALQAAAAAYLDQFPSLVKVGITGSSGKTTTKELAAAMVAMEKRVVMNEGNLNSETGLPLSVFSVRSEHEVGIFEMGMNRVGEMGELAGVLRPHIALIVNVGSAHIGILGSRQAIAEEKKAVFSRFSGTELALVPEADDFASFLASGVNGRVSFYSPGSLRGFDSAKSCGLDGTEIVWDGKRIVFPLPGAHNLSNALAAASIAQALGVSNESIRKALAGAKSLFGRGEILRGEITVVRDCYNANPEAIEAAISFCDSVDWPGRRLYVIGSMLELGERSGAEHRRIGQALASSRADSVFLFGAETRDTLSELASIAPALPVFHSADMAELSAAVAAAARPGDLVLLKGSRGTALERLSDVLVKEGR